jgi:hypothetical protein
MVKKTYESEQITVQWDSSRCIHTAIWLRSLPEVFDVNRPSMDRSRRCSSRIRLMRLSGRHRVETSLLEPLR